MSRRRDQPGPKPLPGGLAYRNDDGGPRRRGGPREGRRPPGPGHRHRDRRGLPGGPQGDGQRDGGIRLHPHRQEISPVEGRRSAGAATRPPERGGVGAPAVWVRAGAHAPAVSPPDPVGGAHSPRRLHRGDRGREGADETAPVRPGRRGAAGRPRSPDPPAAGTGHRRRQPPGGGAGAEGPGHLGTALKFPLPGGGAGRFNPPPARTPGICGPPRRSNPREPIRWRPRRTPPRSPGPPRRRRTGRPSRGDR